MSKSFKEATVTPKDRPCAIQQTEHHLAEVLYSFYIYRIVLQTVLLVQWCSDQHTLYPYEGGPRFDSCLSQMML